MKKILSYFFISLLTFLVGYFIFNKLLVTSEMPVIIKQKATQEQVVDKQISPSINANTDDQLVEIMEGVSVPESKISLLEIYSNPLNGIEVDFPREFKADENGVYFGPMVVIPEGPSTRKGHQYQMVFTEPRTIAETEEFIKADQLTEFFSSELFGDNDLSIVKYIGSGMCSYPTIEIIGAKHNYVFSPACGMNDDTEFAFMEEILKTAKLIPDYNDPAWKYCESVGETITTFTAENMGGQYYVYVGHSKTFEQCLINDGLDGIRCPLDLYYSKECGHPNSRLSPTNNF